MDEVYPESEWYIDNGVRYKRAVIDQKRIKAKQNKSKTDKKEKVEEENKHEENHETIHAEENQ